MTTDGATLQQGVPENEIEETVISTPHDKAMAELVAKRMAAEGRAPVAEDSKESEPAREELQKPFAAEASRIAPQIRFVTDDGTEIDVPATARLKIKSDGEEVNETLDKLTRSYQKGATADKRLEQASLLKQSLERKEEALVAKGRDLSLQEQRVLGQLQKMEEKHSEGKLSTDAYRMKAQQFVDALLSDEDPVGKVANILPSLLPTPGRDENDKVDIDKLRTDVKHAVRAEMDLDEARTKFYAEYSDLAADDVLHDLVNQQTVVIQEKNPSAKPWDIIKQAAEDVRVWQKKVAGNQTVKQEPSPRPSPRPQPQANAATKAVVGEDVKPKTRRDVLNEIRKERGQPPL